MAIVTSPPDFARRILMLSAVLLLGLTASSLHSQQLVDLPDAPEASSLAIAPGAMGAPGSAVQKPPTPTAEDCALNPTNAPQCRVHWRQLFISSAVFNGFQNAGNLYTGYWYRYETMHGKWWDRYVNSVEGWAWNRWDDYNPFLDDYVGHPMMGAISDYLWIQNDPKSMAVVQSNTWPYWRRMLRAGAYATAYSFQWKFGPLGEESIGHDGDHLVPDGKIYSNETGWVELVTTPVGGGLWTMAEDALDQHVITHLENESRNPFALTIYQFLSPSRAAANILRFRPPWYRDTRVVKANSFWSDPPGEYLVGKANPDVVPAADEETPGGGDPAESAEETANAAHALAAASAANEDSESSSSALGDPGVQRPPSSQRYLPIWPYPGGVHEFGAWWGLSLMTGHIWGFAPDVKYMPIDVRYTYLISPHPYWNLRYAPEMTALAMLDWMDPKPTSKFDQRIRAYGSGISPAGFQASFLPAKRVQPYLSTDGGFIYFDKRVLSPEGSQWMYTIDFGTGIQIFRKNRQSVSIGYRYQHLSNANISMHNPGTDANTFYVAVSRFRTKGYR